MEVARISGSGPIQATTDGFKSVATVATAADDALGQLAQACGLTAMPATDNEWHKVLDLRLAQFMRELEAHNKTADNDLLQQIKRVECLVRRVANWRPSPIRKARGARGRKRALKVVPQ